MQIEQINQPMSDLASQAWSDPCVYVATQLKEMQLLNCYATVCSINYNYIIYNYIYCYCIFLCEKYLLQEIVNST